MEIKKNLTMKDFEEMCALEKRFYGSDHITPPEEVFKWHEQFPNLSTVLEDDGKIIGFLDLFPIKKHIFSKIKKGVFNDADLVAEDIVNPDELPKGEKVNMYLCCIVVDEKYRKKGALEMLFKKQIAYFKKYEEKGIAFDSIITDNVTDSGRHFSLRKGFQKVTETIFNSTVYMQKYDKFVTQFNG